MLKLGLAKGLKRPPLRTVSEIAESLGVTQQELQAALRREDAPKPNIRGSEAGHRKAWRVWYDPREVIAWFKALPPETPEERKEKRREYYRANVETILESQRRYRQRCKNKKEQT